MGALSPGYPSYGPAATVWLKSLNEDPYFAAPEGPAFKAAANLVWKGWSMVTYPDQPVWSNTVITQLVTGKSLSSLLPAFGDGLAQNAHLDRIKEPGKRWKFSMNDVAERKLWAKYMAAFEDMIRNTSTPEAPWFVVPADHKWFTRVVVAAALVQAMQALDLEYPKVKGKALKELRQAEKALKAEK